MTSDRPPRPAGAAFVMTPRSGRAEARAVAARLATVVVALVTILAALPFGAAGHAQDAEDADALVGEYAVTFTDEEIPITLVGGPGLVGDWVVIFAADGSYEVRRQDVGTVVVGAYEVDGQTVTVTDEGGVLSCATPQAGGDPIETGTYTFEPSGDRLTLRVVEDGCATREYLFTTRPLGPFVACRTVAVPLSAEPADPGAEGDDGSALDALEEEVGGEDANGPDEDQAETPTAPAEEEDAAESADEDATPAATPGAGATPEGDATPGTGATPVGEASPTPPAEIGTDEDPEAAIDDLLGQMTACWATGDPALVLPLFSPQLLDELTGGGAASLRDVADQLLQIQTVPITWERAGEVELTDEDETEAEAIVALRIGAEESFETLAFVLTDDGWRFVTFLGDA
jgi:hypothetical protein